MEKDELHAFEFAVSVALGFNLHVPVRYVRYHYDLLTRQTVELPSVYAIPLSEPGFAMTIPRMSFNVTFRPINLRQLSWTNGYSRSNHARSGHKVNAKLAHAKRK